jgi:hypothetical protein
MHPSLRDQTHAISSFGGAPGLDPDDIVDPYAPGILFKGPIWPMNFVLLNWYALAIVHRYQTALALQCQPPIEVERMALQTCQLAEAIEYYPEAPPGALTAAYISLPVASLFLPKDDQHIAWTLQKFARIEQLGYGHVHTYTPSCCLDLTAIYRYIYPTAFRIKMSELWDIPDIKHNWFPHGESYPKIIHSIRSFVDDRTRTSADILSPDITDMKAIFGSMRLEEAQSKPSSSGQSSTDYFAHNVATGTGFDDRGFPESQAYWKH